MHPREVEAGARSAPADACCQDCCQDCCRWQQDGDPSWNVAHDPICATVTHDRGPGDSCARPCRVVGQRVDALVIGYVIEWARDTAERPGGAWGTHPDDPHASEVRLIDADGVVKHVRSGAAPQAKKGILKALSQCAREARKVGRARFRFGPLGDDGQPLVRGEMRPPTRPGVYQIENAECTIRIERDAYELREGDRERVASWNTEIEWRAASLATRGPDPWLSRELASAFGFVREERLRRVDLEVTATGWHLVEGDVARLVMRSRCKVDRYAAASASGRRAVEGRAELAVHLGSRRRCTGFSVSPGNPLMARLYDKTAELLAHGDWRKNRDGQIVPATPKGKIEWDVAILAGADPNLGHDLARIEFQVRGEALDELQLRDPTQLMARLQGLWGYLVGERGADTRTPKGAWGFARLVRGERHRGWLRMVVPDRGHVSRRAVDPRWEMLRHVAFYGGVNRGVLARTRALKRGADWRQVMGSAISYLGAAGQLPRLVRVRSRERPGEWATGEEMASILGSNGAHYVEKLAGQLWTAVGRAITSELQSDRGPEAIGWLYDRIDATADRFERIAFDSEVAEYVRRIEPGAPPVWEQPPMKTRPSSEVRGRALGVIKARIHAQKHRERLDAIVPLAS